MNSARPVRGTLEDPRTIISLVVLYVVWGSTYYAMRIALEAFPPLMMGAIRFLIAGGVLLIVHRGRGAPWPTAREWLHSVPVGGLLFFVGNGFVALAETRGASSGAAAVVCATMPIWSAAMGGWFGQKTSAREWMGLAFGFVGILVLMRGGEFTMRPLAAVILCFAPLGWAVGSLLGRTLTLPAGMMAAATEMLTGGGLLLIGSWVTGERSTQLMTLRSMAAFLYLIVFGSLVAFSAYTYVLRHARTPLAMSYAYVNPAIAVGIGAFLGAERVGWATLLATGIIVAGIVQIVSPDRRLRVMKGSSHGKPHSDR